MVGVKAGVQIWEAGKRLPLDTVEWGGLRRVGEPSNRPLEMHCWGSGLKGWGHPGPRESQMHSWLVTEARGRVLSAER